MDFESNTVFAISCAIDVVLVVGAVVWSLRTRRVITAALALFGALAAKGIVMKAAGLDLFGVAHVLWLDLIVVLPVAAVVAAVMARGAIRIVAVAAMLLAPIGAYASLVVPDQLKTERADVPLAKERAGRQPIRIGVLADLQFERVGDHERAAVARVMREKPDLILLPGDYHQASQASFERERPAIRRLMSGLKAPGGVFAVHGDSEGREKARQVFAGTGVRLLYDQTARVRVKDRTITLFGSRLEFWDPSSADAAHAFEGRSGKNDIRLLLAHRPDVVFKLASPTRVDLVVAGHTHGGQVQLPIIGPPFTASDVPRAVAAGGLHEVDGRRVYVSRGVGLERGQAPRLRFGAVPEVSLITLR